MKIYVGNMAFSTTEQQLRAAFEAFGTVDEVAVINDRDTGRPKGFAFVTMPNAQEANAAINALNEQDMGGRNLRVNEARPKAEGGGGGGGYGGGGGGRNRW
ncbi:MAG: RNA-binding protein [bacterium]|jgi:RNA recognition motif-containing protein|nr:RNA-binding protein [bacterium]